MKFIYPFNALIILLVISCSCLTSAVEHSERPTNAVYYWKTVLDIDSTDLAFIRRHDIGRIYLRMFDVVEADYPYPADERVIPNATVRIPDPQFNLLQDSLKEIEFVPTVYVTLDALMAMWAREGELAANIVRRVSNMVRYNSLPNVAELQLDCDWTESSEDDFFNLCDSVKKYIAADSLNWKLSATIRLHQLAHNPPPVDKGVLMVYNTGSFNNQDTHNSIIDLSDVKPYLRNLAYYPLHLDIAYPTYSWQLLFRDRKFVGLINGLPLDNDTLFSRKGNLYAVKKDFTLNNIRLLAGDVVRAEESSPQEVITTKNMIERLFKDHPHSNIIYHLDSKNLSKYSSDEINQIFYAGI
ncbi:MAG: hypothetical protein K2M10_09190 [Muribaculaceae bacterium]|nr:hypothetical protein [Muribaculaceae bacterium]